MTFDYFVVSYHPVSDIIIMLSSQRFSCIILLPSAHARRLRLACVCVCVFVCPSVTALTDDSVSRYSSCTFGTNGGQQLPEAQLIHDRSNVASDTCNLHETREIQETAC